MREIRPYGSARGVRRNPYPYRDVASTRCVSTALRTHPRKSASASGNPSVVAHLHQISPRFRAANRRHHRHGKAAPIGSQSRCKSGGQKTANRVGISARIGIGKGG
jgi:hypothetical protein